jgi:hypothetical protein
MQEQTARPGTLGQMIDASHPRRPQSETLMLVPLAVAVVAAAAIVAWLVLVHRGSATQATVPAGPVLVTAGQLASAAHTLGHPVYWAGPRANWSYELTVTKSGRVYVRYLPRGAKAGDSRSSFLTVGTYPGANAYANLKKVSTGPAVHSNLLPAGGLMVAPKSLPKSVYVAYPRRDYQVEVYDASAGAARRLTLNGLIKPVG